MGVEMVDPGIDVSGIDISFGRFRLLPARRLLLEEDKPVRIGSRAFDLLIALTERPGEIISKAELTAKVWPDIFVGEGSLKVHIRSLRCTLGDDQAGSRYISTVIGRGYSFVSPVSATTRADARTVPQAITDSLGAVISPLRSAIGRNELIGKSLVQLLDQCLNTSAGPDGIGRKSVAVAITDRPPARSLAVRESAGRENSLCYVDLATVSDPWLLPTTLATALGVEDRAGDPSARLLSFFRSERMLLVLDNCERMIEALINLASKIAGVRQTPEVGRIQEPQEARSKRRASESRCLGPRRARYRMIPDGDRDNALEPATSEGSRTPRRAPDDRAGRGLRPNREVMSIQSLCANPSKPKPSGANPFERSDAPVAQRLSGRIGRHSRSEVGPNGTQRT